MSSFVASSEQGSRALFEYTWGFGKASTGPPCNQMPKNNRRRTPRPCPKPRPPTPPDPRRARKPTSGAVVPLNRVRTGGGRGVSVPRPPGAGVPGWFGPGRRLGPPVALRQPSGSLGGRRGAWDYPLNFNASRTHQSEPRIENGFIEPGFRPHMPSRTLWDSVVASDGPRGTGGARGPPFSGPRG